MSRFFPFPKVGYGIGLRLPPRRRRGRGWRNGGWGQRSGRRDAWPKDGGAGSWNLVVWVWVVDSYSRCLLRLFFCFCCLSFRKLHPWNFTLYPEKNYYFQKRKSKYYKHCSSGIICVFSCVGVKPSEMIFFRFVLVAAGIGWSSYNRHWVEVFPTFLSSKFFRIFAEDDIL